MPQLTNSIALPMNNDAIDKDEAKYSGDAHFRITSVRSEYVNNNVDSDIVLNCDNLNLIEIKEELLDTFEMPAIADKDLLLSSCDTTTTAANATNAENGAKMKTTNNNTTYLCHRCRQMFSSRDQFEVHYRQSYNETPIYTCHICDKQMKNKRSYQRHFNRHLGAQKFACTICSKKFSQEKLLKKHESVHNLTTAKSCLECKEEFFDLFKFKAHRRTHHTQNKKPQLYQCADCGKIMKNRSSLSMHAKIHSNDRQYGCMMCDQKFVQKINLINHLKVHNAAKTHSCNDCGKSFVGQSQLLRHCTQHTNVRAFECEICKKFYKTKRDLKLHLMVHSVQRPHKCGMCSKTFLSTSKLKQHLNIHSGNRPFKCRHCPKDFTNFPNWLKHTRRRHKVDHKTGEKLVVMPNFLNKSNKTNKSGKIKSAKRTAKIETKQNDMNVAEPNVTPDTMKIESVSVATDGAIDNGGGGGGVNFYSPTENGQTNHEMAADEKDREKDNVDIDKCTMPFVVTKSGSDLSTITVNNRTLPLNTSDDLERAASLLMHQTLDFEDEFEFVNVKSESVDLGVSDGGDGGGDETGSDPTTTSDDLPSFTRTESTTYHLPNEFPSFHYSTSCGPDFLYTYYPQATQCDFAMMPLPPINTVKRKLKGISSSSSIFPGMTNVL